MKFYEKLDILLNRKHIRRGDFAKRIGVTYRAFAYYLTGDRVPRRSVMERIARELDVTADYLEDESVEIELFPEEKFARQIAENGTDPTEAMRFLSNSRGLFAGNELSEEDKLRLLNCLTEIYEDSRKK